MIWVPEVMVGDRPLIAGNSTIQDVKVGAVLSTAVLLLEDLNQMVDIYEYENFGLMMQHSILVSFLIYSLIVIQHLVRFLIICFNLCRPSSTRIHTRSRQR